MDLDILFIGKVFPVEKEAEIKSKMKTGMQDAGNALQWNIIHGLDDNHCGTVKILDYLPIDSWPNGYADRRIEEYVFQHTDKYRSDDKIVGCTNLTVVKQFVNRGPFKREIKKWLRQGDPKKKVIMIYTASSIFLELCQYAKKLCRDVTTCCIIADLPEFLSARKLTGIKKLFNDYETRQSAVRYRYIDRFVLLTKQMADKLQITVPFTVVEGIASDLDTPCDHTLAKKYEKEKYILYTGTLNPQFGIMTLLEAFSQMQDPDIKLMICGFGEAEAQILQMQKTDPRIIYLGKVDRKAVLPLQRGATVLVNPRQNNEEFTKYSFPSKTMEYLASGVPVVAYKLDGIPDEYDEYLNYVEDNSAESLAKTLTQICNMDEAARSQMGKRGAAFVLENKHARVQTRRILELING